MQAICTCCPWMYKSLHLYHHFAKTQGGRTIREIVLGEWYVNRCVENGRCRNITPPLSTCQQRTGQETVTLLDLPYLILDDLLLSKWHEASDFRTSPNKIRAFFGFALDDFRFLFLHDWYGLSYSQDQIYWGLADFFPQTTFLSVRNWFVEYLFNYILLEVATNFWRWRI